MPVIDFWLAISFLASRTILFPASLLLILYCLYVKKKKEAAWAAAGFYGGVALNYALKRIFQLPRPSNSLIAIDGYAFPSGHALSAVIFYSLLIAIVHKEIKNKVVRIGFITANILIILSVGLSRIMLKVHTVYDVIGGSVIGLLWLFVMYRFLQKINP
ncbi:MAG: phosphatase PAP2 family protein [Nanoarchaeota archaeon]|nr:phosphatase PAP2 family protein [Nanoarchaeota archaeon]